MGMCYCTKCGRTKQDKEFYTSRNIEKYPPAGKIPICKQCLTMHIDNWDPSTYMDILKEIDVPYVEKEWNKLLEKYGTDPTKISGSAIIGRYLSKMKLRQYANERFADTDRLAEEEKQLKVTTMKSQGYSDEEIEGELSREQAPPRPELPDEFFEGAEKAPAAESSLSSSFVEEQIQKQQEENDAIAESLTEEDKTQLRIKWGPGYRAEEWVRMEQLYREMMESFDIQTAAHKDTLIMLCKTSLKANQCLDAGDIESFQRLQKAYDSLMKAGKFQAIQNKEEQGEFVDSIGELVAACERDGFIPRYYTDEPNDKVDRVIQDMQKYTKDLVIEELGLGNLIENAVRSLEVERERIAAAAEAGGDFDGGQEAELFDYNSNSASLDDQDFIDFDNIMEEGREL